MDSYEDIHNYLAKNLFLASVCYIPRHVLNTIFVENERENILYDYSNKVFVLESNGNNYFIDKDTPIGSHILLKKTVLDRNLLKLMEIEDQKTIKIFQFISNDYMEKINGLYTIANYYTENLNSDIKYSGKHIKRAFEIQLECIEKHVTDLNEKLNLKPLSSDPNPMSLVENGMDFIKEVTDEDNNKDLFQKQYDLMLQKRDKKSNIHQLKSNTLLLSEDLILESIFNVDFSIITDKKQ